MEFVANYVDATIAPGAWAVQRQAEGWTGLGVADHLWDRGRAYPHVWVALGVMAAVTTRPILTSSFANNLLRSPVDVAQAAFAMQQASDGRFEVGLGAGWSRDEIVGSGLVYPSPGERVERYREAILALRDLLEHRATRFQGQHYQLDVPAIGPPGERPPLVASLGGPRSIGEIAPLVDRVEIKFTSTATRGGNLDYAAFAAIGPDHLRDLIERVRDANPTVPLGTFVQVGCGADPRLTQLADTFGGTWMGNFIGEPAKVADALLTLEDLGIERVQLTPYVGATFELLAPELLAPELVAR